VGGLWPKSYPPNNLIESLQNQGIFHLNQITDRLTTNLFSQGWVTTNQISLEGGVFAV
jgi:hypothetical protein